MAILTVAILTMAILTVAILTMAILLLTMAATSPGSRCSTPHLTSWLRDRGRVRVGVRGKVRVGSGLRVGVEP